MNAGQSMVRLGVELVLLGAFLSIVTFILLMGMDFRADSLNKVSGLHTAMQTTILDSIATNEVNLMNKATLYNILLKEYVGVGVIDLDGAIFEPNEKGRWQKTNDSLDTTQYIYTYDILSGAEVLNSTTGLSGNVNVVLEMQDTGMYKLIIRTI